MLAKNYVFVLRLVAVHTNFNYTLLKCFYFSKTEKFKLCFNKPTLGGTCFKTFATCTFDLGGGATANYRATPYLIVRKVKGVS